MADRTEQQIIDEVNTRGKIHRLDIYDIMMMMPEDDKKDKEKKKTHVDNFLKKLDKEITGKKDKVGRVASEKILDDLESYPV